MLVKNRLSIDRWNKVLDYLFLAFTCVTILSGVFCFFLFMGGPFQTKPLKIEAPSKKKSVKIDTIQSSTIGQGVWIPLPPVEEKVFFFGIDKRPSMQGGVWLGTKADGKSLYRVGDKLFLECKNEQEISFSKEPTPFWLELTRCDDRGVEAVFSSSYATQQGEPLVSFTKEVRLQQRSGGNREGKNRFIQTLAKMKYYGSDQFLDLYGGDFFKEVRGQSRLDLEGKGERFHFIAGGERFIWNGEKWISSKEEKGGEPILWVEKIEGGACHLILFDAEGYTMRTYLVRQEKPVETFSLKPADLFTSLRMRTHKSILCKIGHHNRIVRVGDWLLRSKKGWRSLQSREDVKSYLCYGLSGELFVFDAIVEGNGEYLFTGHLFDEKRTSVRKIELPMHAPLSKGKMRPKGETKPVGQPFERFPGNPQVEPLVEDSEDDDDL